MLPRLLQLHCLPLVPGILVATNVASATMCMAIGAAAPSNALANLVGSLTLMLLLLFGGFLLNKEAVPSYCAWVRRASFFNYAYEVRRARDTCTCVAHTVVF